MKKLILTYLLGIFCLCGNAQSWVQLGNGIKPLAPVHIKTVSTFYNGKLYVAERVQNGNVDHINLYIWSGSSWSTVPAFTRNNLVNTSDIIGYQGKIYISSGGLVLRYDGDSIRQVSGVPSAVHIDDLEVAGNKLYASGRYNNATLFNLIAAEYDGNIWNLLPPLGLGINRTLFGGKQIINFNGSLYVRTKKDSLDIIPTNLFKYNSNTASWNYAFQFFDKPALTKQYLNIVLTDGQRMFAQGTDSNDKTIMEVRNDSVIDIYSDGNSFNINDQVNFNNKIYLSGSFGNQQKSLATFHGNILTPLLNSPNGNLNNVPITSMATDGNLLYTAGNFTIFNGTTYNSVMATNGDFASVSGNVFIDLNSDCLQTSGEKKINAAIVTLKPGNHQLTTNINGDFNGGLPPGNYTIAGISFISPAHQNLSLATCGNGNITTIMNQNSIHDVAVDFTSSDPDLVTQLSSFTAWRARYGFTENYKLSVYNAGITNEQNITVDVVLPAGLQILSSNPAYNSQNTNTYTWNLPSLNSLKDFHAGFSIVIDTALVNMGDSLIFTSTVSTANGEVNTSNNTVNLAQEVVGAYDPNDKTASAKELESGTDELEYIIRFQNTGSDTAFTVTIRDTLSPDFILSELKMISSSHNYEMQTKHNVISWIFNDILLPDSTVDYSGSQGYVHFSIGIDPTLTVGEVIDNDAEIYFDYQQPVHTNHAQTTIVENISLVENFYKQLSLDVYPNPAKDRITVQNKTSEIQNLKIYNTLGQLVKVIDIEKGSTSEIQLDDLNTGVYFIRTVTETYRLVIAE